MNTQQDTPKTVITLDMICQQKAEKLAEIRASKQRISNQARELFHPSETTGSTNALMNNFSSGIAIFNGVMTGFKIIKRIRNLFRRKY
ncbi:MAG: hypothetical protein IJE78_03740 [Bacteroidaceae bacterium]|nr:hypothetical protein [Bacteroidaceae bacterium]